MSTTWMQWKHGIVEVIRCDYRELLPSVQMDDIDWDAWKPLYEKGFTPDAAVSNAFSPTPQRSGSVAERAA